MSFAQGIAGNLGDRFFRYFRFRGRSRRLLGGVVGGDGFEFPGDFPDMFFPKLLHLLFRDDVLFCQFFRPDAQHPWMLIYLFVYHGLGESRFVRLVVSVPPVADEVYEEMLFELGRVAEGQAYRLYAGDRVVRVYVDDRYFESLGEIACVKRASAVGGKRGVAELVVGDYVYRSAGAVAREGGEVKRFRVYPLSHERRVSVYLDRDYR